MEDYFNEKIHELSIKLKDQESAASITRGHITWYNQQHQAFKLQRETALASFADTTEAEKHVNEWKAVIRKLEKRRPEAPIVYLRVIYARPGRRPRTIGLIDETTQSASAVPTDIQKKALTALGMRIDFVGAGNHGYTPREESPRMDPYMEVAPDVTRSRGIAPRHVIIGGHYPSVASPRVYRRPEIVTKERSHHRSSSKKKKHSSKKKSHSKSSNSKSVPTPATPREEIIVLKD